MIWLAGNSFYGSKQIFSPEFLRWLADYSLPEYELKRHNGQFELSFPGRWVRHHDVGNPGACHHQRAALARRAQGLWPVHARCHLCPRQGQDVGEGRAVEAASGSPHFRFRHKAAAFLPVAALVRRSAEGGSRREFHRHLECAARMDNDLEALGTNAHELPMVLAAIAPNEEALKAAPYQVLQDWESYYGGNLLIVLPDAFGTDSFLRDAPDWVADWTGFRPDSAPEIEGGEADHPVLERARPRSARKAADLFRRARCRCHRGRLSPFQRTRAHGLRLGPPISPMISPAARPFPIPGSIRCRWWSRSLRPMAGRR